MRRFPLLYFSPHFSFERSTSKNPFFARRMQFHGKVGAAAAQLVAEAELNGLLAVDGKKSLVRDALDAHQNAGRAGQDHGAQRELMRTDGRHHQGVDLGISTGPPAARE